MFNVFCKAKFTKSWLSRHLFRGIRASMSQATWLLHHSKHDGCTFYRLPGYIPLIYWNTVQCNLEHLRNVFRPKYNRRKNENVQPRLDSSVTTLNKPSRYSMRIGVSTFSQFCGFVVNRWPKETNLLNTIKQLVWQFLLMKLDLDFETNKYKWRYVPLTNLGA